MNKRQLLVIWCALLIAASMIWFPGSWFGYIVMGYPAIRPDSVEFLVRIILPLSAFTIMLSYCLRTRQGSAAGSMQMRSYRPRRFSFWYALLILCAGLMTGFIGGYVMLSRSDHPVDVKRGESRKPDEVDDAFRNFCRREGYRQEVEALTEWLSDAKVNRIGILYNGDDAYSHDLYTYFLQSLPEKKITVAYSDMYKEGNTSFFREIKALESAQPEAIIFLGRYEERMNFLETIAQQPQAEFWQERLKKIRWIE